jgi:XTP/dITP diphosphohydrolase
VARGEVEGVIAHVPKGTNGFGYDPLFVVPSLGKSFAELSSSEKNSMSHRANALKILCEMIGKIDENTGN